ncbi:MAG: His-Xaa-Ser system radical SAM maturase HxsB [Candidatus Omnitrophota bacterium]
MPLNMLSTKRIGKKVGFFRFKKLNDGYLLTNETGEYVFLNPEDFESFVFEKPGLKNIERYNDLVERGFIKTEDKNDLLIQKYLRRNSFFNEGVTLHIVVITLRCNNSCTYCQSSAGLPNDKSLDMSLETAKDVVDKIFQTPNPSFTIEFQGGEPLINFDIVKFIITYSKEKNITANKKINFSLVTNLALLTDEKFDFLMKQEVSLCTSLDGPRLLHNKNRIALNNKHDSYADVLRGIKKIRSCQKKSGFNTKLNALLTVTKDSLKYPREIVDEYVKLGFDKIFLRHLNTFVFPAKIKSKLQYSAEDFLVFYKKAMDYIIALNKRGVIFQECTAYILLVKILKGADPNFMDLRSPCGAVIGQLAYNFNGDVYTCDEGRMFGRKGDDTFKLGNVRDNCFLDFLNSPIAKTMCVASCLDNLPGCADCVYKPYCGVCPLMKYAENGNIFGSCRGDMRCAIFSGILDYLFEKIQDQNCLKIFQNWINLP